MTITTRQRQILELLERSPDITVKEIAERLHSSEPTVRRDFTELDARGFITKVYGGAKLLRGSADSEIPFLLRENERSAAKVEMGRSAAEYIRDGMVVMLDGSTSAYYIVPYLSRFKDLIVITSGAKTAVALAEQNIRTFSTGGQMIIHSFSYVGEQAENFVRGVNADILFFSCRGVSADGKMTDVSIEEVNLRRVMFGHSRQKILLCDTTKFGKTYFYNLGHVRDIDRVISNKPFEFDFSNPPDSQ